MVGMQIPVTRLTPAARKEGTGGYEREPGVVS